MKEADLKRGLVRAFNDLDGVFSFRVETSTLNGCPDLVANRFGRSAWIEVKYHRPFTTKWKLQPLQERILRRLDGYLVTYIEQRDGTKTASVLSYQDGVEQVFVATRGWPKAHVFVAEEIAFARLDL